MTIIWNEEKATWLLEERGIRLEEIAELIQEGHILDVLKHRSHHSQRISFIRYKGYVLGIPFVMLPDDTVVLRTAYPSRKLRKIYGATKKHTADERGTGDRGLDP